MRVLQLNIDYAGTGADRCARELYQELPKLGIKTEMWVSKRVPGMPSDVRSIPYTWETISKPMEAFPDLTDWRHRGSIVALRSISNASFDLVHIHNIHSGWISVRAVRELTERFPCVWTLHDEWAPKRGITYDLTGKISPLQAKRLSHGAIRYIPYDRYHENYKWRRTRQFLSRYMPQPKVVICPSGYLADLSRSAQIFPHADIVEIPNGTFMLQVNESTMPREKARLALGLRPDLSTVLMISADLAQAHKGIGIGIAAIKEASSKREVQMVLLGKSADYLKRAIEPVAAICLQTTDDAVLARAYRAADVTLIPSLGENFPYVAIESLACGTPIVAFAIGGMPEIIGKDERGIVCSGINPHELSVAMSTILSEPLLQKRLGREGVKWTSENCAMQSYLENVKRAYARALR